MSTIKDAVMRLLEQCDELSGTEQLMIEVNASRKSFLIKSVRSLEGDQQITIIRSQGGRGNKTVYKRNLNQQGLPRKTA